jgi:hypothetical protein
MEGRLQEASTSNLEGDGFGLFEGTVAIISDTL